MAKNNEPVISEMIFELIIESMLSSISSEEFIGNTIWQYLETTFPLPLIYFQFVID